MESFQKLQELFAAKMDLHLQIKEEETALVGTEGTENAAKQTALDQSKDKMTELLQQELLLMQGSFGGQHSATGNDEETPEPDEEGSHMPDLEEPAEQSNMSYSFKLGRPERFKIGHNFSDFCTDFKEHVELTKLKDDNLHLYFLSLLETQVKKKLRKVELTPDQKKSPERFIPIFRRKMMPPHEAQNLQMDFMDIEQKTDESIESFAHRVEDTASLAFAEDSEKARGEACRSAFIKGLRATDVRIKLRESRITVFTDAVEEAIRLQGIQLAEQRRRRSVHEEGAQGPIDIYKIDEHKERESEAVNSRGTYRRGRGSYRPTRGYPSHPRDRNNHGAGAGPSRYESGNREGNKQGKDKLCWKCNLPNHLARHCLSEPLNY